MASLAHLGLSPNRVQTLGFLRGEACFSAELPGDVEPPEGARFCDLRRLFGRMSEELLAVAGRAVQIVEWDRTHQFCGACASPTAPHPKRRARVCTRVGCALEFFPRLAPAMIVSVERDASILLARSPHFPKGIYSVLAGFVDPGESAEDAVHREVFEEVGLTVNNVRYFGSQAWPFPNSLMLGFQADYAGGELVLEADEIEDAGFFPVDALPATFPGRVSISQWLLEDFIARHRERGAEEVAWRSERS
jgi:NAD+ diphosphatase